VQVPLTLSDLIFFSHHVLYYITNTFHIKFTYSIPKKCAYNSCEEALRFFKLQLKVSEVYAMYSFMRCHISYISGGMSRQYSQHYSFLLSHFRLTTYSHILTIPRKGTRVNWSKTGQLRRGGPSALRADAVCVCVCVCV
jgi:hypothetical protein